MKSRHLLSKLHIENQTHLLKSGVGDCTQVTHSCCQLVRYNVENISFKGWHDHSTTRYGSFCCNYAKVEHPLHVIGLFFWVQKKNEASRYLPPENCIIWHLTRQFIAIKKWTFDREIPFVYLPWCLNPWYVLAGFQWENSPPNLGDRRSPTVPINTLGPDPLGHLDDDEFIFCGSHPELMAFVMLL